MRYSQRYSLFKNLTSRRTAFILDWVLIRLLLMQVYLFRGQIHPAQFARIPALKKAISLSNLLCFSRLILSGRL